MSGPVVSGGRGKSGAVRPRPQRPRTIIRGAVAHVDGNFSVACTVRNLTASGARIQLNALERLPDRVILVDRTHRRLYEADVVWRKSPDFGLHFRTSRSFDEIADPEQRRLTQ